MHKHDNSGATAIEYGLIAGRHMRWYERISFGECLMAAAMFIGVQALVLFYYGPTGDLYVWHDKIMGRNC